MLNNCVRAAASSLHKYLEVLGGRTRFKLLLSECEHQVPSCHRVAVTETVTIQGRGRRSRVQDRLGRLIIILIHKDNHAFLIRPHENSDCWTQLELG